MAQQVPPVRGAFLPASCLSWVPAQIFVQKQPRGTDPAANLCGFVATVSFGSSTRIKWFLNNTPRILHGHWFVCEYSSPGNASSKVTQKPKLAYNRRLPIMLKRQHSGILRASLAEDSKEQQHFVHHLPVMY